jgi:hypothetical protein
VTSVNRVMAASGWLLAVLLTVSLLPILTTASDDTGNNTASVARTIPTACVEQSQTHNTSLHLYREPETSTGQMPKPLRGSVLGRDECQAETFVNIHFGGSLANDLYPTTVLGTKAPSHNRRLRTRSWPADISKTERRGRGGSDARLADQATNRSRMSGGAQERPRGPVPFRMEEDTDYKPGGQEQHDIDQQRSVEV